MLADAQNTLFINDLLTRFFQAFDEKNWTLLRSCLDDEIATDYSSFRDVPAGTVAAAAYVEQRRHALQALEMQHNFTNLRVELEPQAETAIARCNYVIHRFHPQRPAGFDHFHSYGHYRFQFVKVSGLWKISRIEQHLLRNYGNREIHGATRPHDCTA